MQILPLSSPKIRISGRGVARNLIGVGKLHDIEFVLGQGDKTTT